jgi:hypothetical protein
MDLLLPQKQDEIGKLVSDRVDSRAGIPEPGSGEQGRIKERHALLIVEQGDSLASAKHMERQLGHGSYSPVPKNK